MKKIITILTLIVSVGHIHAQNTGWESGITLSGGRSSHIITQINSQGQPFAGQIKQFENPSWHYSAGVYGRKFFKQMFGIEIGLQYTSFGLFRKNKNAYFGNQIDPQNGFTGDPYTLKMNYRHNYLELPLRFVFKKDIQKFGIGFFAGVSPALLLTAYNRTVVTQKDYREVHKENGLKQNSSKFNLFADIGLLLRGNITSQFSIDTKPFLRIATLQTYSEPTSSNFEERFISAGVSVSTVWRF
jgi:hypothetical protein